MRICLREKTEWTIIIIANPTKDKNQKKIATISENRGNSIRANTCKWDNVTVLVAIAMINLRPIPDQTMPKKSIKGNYPCTPCTHIY